jgi:hypothetical protein
VILATNNCSFWFVAWSFLRCCFCCWPGETEVIQVRSCGWSAVGKVWGPKNDLTMATTMALSFVPKSGDFSPEWSHHLPSRCGEIHWAFHGKQSVLCRLHFSIMISWRLQKFSWFQLATGHSPSLRTILGSLSASHSDTLDMGTLMQMAYFSTF